MSVELKRQIDILNRELSNDISNDDHLKKIYELITSIKGIGSKKACFCFAFRNGFTRDEELEKFCMLFCIAHFHQLGKSISLVRLEDILAKSIQKSRILLSMTSTGSARQAQHDRVSV